MKLADINSGATYPGELKSYVANGYSCAIADQCSDKEIKECLSDNPMESWIKLSLEREPCYFDGDNLFGKSSAIVVREENAPQGMVAMYTADAIPVHLNGKATQAVYLGGLRIMRGFRNKIRVMKSGYASVVKLFNHRGPWFTSIASDNKPARRILEAGLAYIPRYTPVGDMETLAISVQCAQQKGLLVPATIEDVADILAFYNKNQRKYQYAPAMSKAWLLRLDGKKGLSLDDFWLLKRQGKLIGCLAIWDQRHFKQTRVRGYRFPLNILRIPYNMVSFLLRGITLPEKGQQIQQAYLAFVAFDCDETDLIIDSIREGLHKVKQKNAKLGVLGFSVQNPLLDVVKRHFRHKSYRTTIDSMQWQGDNSLLLDDRPPQPEVAIL